MVTGTGALCLRKVRDEQRTVQEFSFKQHGRGESTTIQSTSKRALNSLQILLHLSHIPPQTTPAESTLQRPQQATKVSCTRGWILFSAFSPPNDQVRPLVSHEKHTNSRGTIFTRRVTADKPRFTTGGETDGGLNTSVLTGEKTEVALFEEYDAKVRDS